MWWVLETKRVSQKYIKLIKDMYGKAITSVRTSEGITSKFPITIGLYIGSTLSSYLFALVTDELTKLIQEKVPQCMLLAEKIVLLDKTNSGVNAQLEVW